MMDDMLGDRINGNRVDGAELKSHLTSFLRQLESSSSLLSSFLSPKELDSLRSFNPITQNDKLELATLLRLFNLTVAMLRKRVLGIEEDIRKSKDTVANPPFSDLDAMASTRKEQLETHRNHLVGLRSMNQRLEETNAEMKEAVQMWRGTIKPMLNQSEKGRDNENPFPAPSPLATPFGSSARISRSLVTPSKPRR